MANCFCILALVCVTAAVAVESASLKDGNAAEMRAWTFNFGPFTYTLENRKKCPKELEGQWVVVGNKTCRCKRAGGILFPSFSFELCKPTPTPTPTTTLSPVEITTATGPVTGSSTQATGPVVGTSTEAPGPVTGTSTEATGPVVGTSSEAPGPVTGTSTEETAPVVTTSVSP